MNNTLYDILTGIDGDTNRDAWSLIIASETKVPYSTCRKQVDEKEGLKDSFMRRIKVLRYVASLHGCTLDELIKLMEGE